MLAAKLGGGLEMAVDHDARGSAADAARGFEIGVEDRGHEEPPGTKGYLQEALALLTEEGGFKPSLACQAGAVLVAGGIDWLHRVQVGQSVRDGRLSRGGLFGRRALPGGRRSVGG